MNRPIRDAAEAGGDRSLMIILLAHEDPEDWVQEYITWRPCLTT